MIKTTTKALRTVAPVVLLGTALGACAIGNTYDYRRTAPKVDVTSSREATLAVIDRRPYIINKDKNPDFVGLQRAGLGNPWNVRTTSGKALADDFRGVLINSLRSAGMKVEPAKVPFLASSEQAVAVFTQSSVDRSVLLIVRDWKTDTYARIALHFDLELQVYDKSALLASKRIRGRHAIGAAALPSQVGLAAISAAAQKMSELLNDPKIAAALRDGPTGPPTN